MFSNGELGLGQTISRKIRTAKAIFRQSPAAFWKHLAGRWRYFLVFSARIDGIELPPGNTGMECRKLNDAELAAATQLDGLTKEQIAEFQDAGFNGAYGVCCNGKLAHISWIVTRQDEREDTPVGLGDDEIEITYCVTLPEFRGRGLYPFAIRSLCSIAHGRGFKRVFMKTEESNLASQKGIQTAGLKPSGYILTFTAPYLFGHHLLRKDYRNYLD
jgi:RimJ/RimL family protein N-acetyltransferase